MTQLAPTTYFGKPPAGPITGAERLLARQGNTDVNITPTNLVAFVEGSYSLITAPSPTFSFAFPSAPIYGASLHIVGLTGAIAGNGTLPAITLPSMYDPNGNLIGHDGQLVEITCQGYAITGVAFHGGVNDVGPGVGWYDQPTSIQANVPLILKFILATKNWLCISGGF